MAARLSISVVSYRSRLDLLAQTLDSLSKAIAFAQEAGSLAAARVDLIDNGTDHPEQLRTLAESVGACKISGHGNVGYGCGHNLSLLKSQADYHLVLNPDVIIEPDAIDIALRYMGVNSEVVMLAPEIRSEDGSNTHLCKRYPTVLALALRGFAPNWLRRQFAPRLEHYEMRDLAPDLPEDGIPIISGSFMFCRRVPLVKVGGFSDAFFLYFEDFDLSLRLASLGTVAYVPQVKAFHFGGHAASKGLGHILLFSRGAWTFFQRHGWKWW